jgi:hypothetical protein
MEQYRLITQYKTIITSSSKESLEQKYKEKPTAYTSAPFLVRLPVS